METIRRGKCFLGARKTVLNSLELKDRSLTLFRIKICGITNVDDAHFAVDQGADALGLNFYSRSPRSISPEAAATVSQSFKPSQAKLVGVFVNESANQLWTIAHTAKLDAWQLHGDEPPSLLATLLHGKSSQQLVRAFRCREHDLAAVHSFLCDCRSANGLPNAVLLDAYAPDAFGGTGKVVDWNIVREQRDQLFGLPVILAGGLTPDNVAEAIRTARPDAVDVASGVESSPRKKDPAKVRDFIAAAQAAFAEIAQN
jgi:phosphoribosylanthranilate isomerase